MPVASALSVLGVAKNTMVSFNTVAQNVGATSLTVQNSGAATSTAKIIIFDGANTEIVTASALAANVFTISATTKAHAFGCVVASIGTTAALSTDFMPWTGLTPYDEITWLDDKGMRGSRVDTYDQVAGPRKAEFEMAGDVFADTIGWPLFSVLNDQSFAGGTPNTWTGAVKNSGSGQPSGLQYVDYNSLVARAIAGVVHSEIAFSFNADGKMTYTTKGNGFVSGPVTTPTPSYSTLAVIPAWGITAQIGGVANILVQEGSLSIKPTSVEAINTLDGAQDPYGFFAGAVEATGKMLFVYEDDTQITNFLTNAKPSLDFTFARGAAATLEQVQFHMTTVGYRVGKQQRSKAYSEVEVEFTALGNTTDAGASGGRSPIKATLKNSLSNTGRYQ